MATKYNKDSIVVIRDDRDRVRQSPNMYIPNRGKEGAIHCYFEIIDNSIDELTIPDSAGTKLDITFDKSTKELSVRDDGRGIPLEKLYDVLTVLAASGKFNNSDQTAYTASGGVFGHGSTVVMVLAKQFECMSTREGKSLKYVFEDGLKVSEESGKAKGHGTYTRLIMDPKFVDASDVSDLDIRKRLEEKSFVFPNLDITFKTYDNGKEIKTYHYGGHDISQYLDRWKTSSNIIRVTDRREVTFLRNVTDDKVSTEKINVDLAFAFSEEVLDGEADDFVVSYCNTIKTYEGGTHVEGLKLGIQKWFKEKIVPTVKGKDKDLQILPSDMVAGLCAFVTVSLSSPEFRGQEKTQLSNSEVKFAVRDAVYDALKDIKSSVANAMVDFIKRVARGRLSSKKARKKDVGNAFSKDRLDKYVDIVYNMDTVFPQLILCEGQSY